MTIDDLLKKGTLKRITGADPAAGAEVSVTVPALTTWLVISARANLVTSAVVGTRIPWLVADDGALEFFHSVPAASPTASTTTRMCWTTGSGDGIATGERVANHLPDLGLPLLAGYRLRSVTQGLDPGDNWSALELLVAELA